MHVDLDRSLPLSGNQMLRLVVGLGCVKTWANTSYAVIGKHDADIASETCNGGRLLERVHGIHQTIRVSALTFFEQIQGLFNQPRISRFDIINRKKTPIYIYTSHYSNPSPQRSVTLRSATLHPSM